MKKNKFKFQVAAGVILILCGAPLLLSNYIKEKRDTVFSEMNLALSEINNIVEEEPEIIDEIIDDEVNEEVKEFVEKTKEYEEYLGIVDIPKINLYRGFYNKNSSLNNVKFNLYVLKESNYPDVENGNLIIAGHSGNYNNSYFKDLYLLENGDNVIIHYNNSKYVYKITRIYTEVKDGDVRIFRNNNKTTLTLITCTKDDSNHQTIYISELIEIR